MHKLTPKERAAAYAKMRAKDPTLKQELAAAHAVLRETASSGVSPAVRNAGLTSGMGALAGRVSGLLLADEPHLLHRHGHAALHRPHTSVPALLAADDMFQQAERLCSRVKGLSDAEMWSREWGAMTCSPMAKSMCAEAAQLYKHAIERKYLPAYAPLAWMMSYSHPHESLRLCDECIEHIEEYAPRIGAPFARKAKTDCTALRAYLQYEHDMKLQDELEMETPFPGGRMEEVPAMKAPPIEELHKIAEESMAKDSKYGYALKWSLLSHADADAKTVQKRAEEMGLDFQRCRFCVD